jgi:hypothetical protein
MGDERDNSQESTRMNREKTSATVATLALLGFVTAAPAAADVESPFCSLPPDPASPWLPTTPLPNEATIPAPRPASDCQFYRPAWQRFLVATQPMNGTPTFLRYPSFSDVFPTDKVTDIKPMAERKVLLELSPRSVQRPNEPTKGQQELLDKTQAGLDGAQGGYLLDQHGRFIYYAIHVNPAFLQFLENQNLRTVGGIQQLDPALTFLGGDSDIQAGANNSVVEYKSAWMIVDPEHPPSDYIVVAARAPHYIVQENALVQQKLDGKFVSDPVKVALIALHVVFTLPGHPEMIWSTFEHTHLDGEGNAVRDNAPAAPDNPSSPKSAPSVEASPQNFPLYKAHTVLKDANKPILDLSSIAKFWDDKAQAFSQGGTAIQTSVYRPYPGSKTDGSATHPDHSEDDEVIRINRHATTMFKDAVAKGIISASDPRQNYRLVGAIWLDQPASGAAPSFLVKKSFTIDSSQSTDDDGELIAGEGRLGSTAMESFTESEGGAPNCFSCHDTNAVRHNRLLIGPARLNVSHVLSKYMDSKMPPEK